MAIESLLPFFQAHPFALGGASLSGEGGGYSFGPMSEQQAIDLVLQAFDHGLRVFDSAPIYGKGHSERRLGKAFATGERRIGGASLREQVCLISKSGVSWHPNGRINMTNDPKVCEQQLLQSLKDFQTDYIDLYFIHWPDSRVDIRYPLEVLSKYQRLGAIRHIGLCNTNAQDLAAAGQVVKIDVLQSEFNLFTLQQRQLELDFCRQHQALFMGWGIIDKGILTGHYRPDRHYDPLDCRRSAPWFKKTEVVKKVQRVQQLVDLLGMSTEQVQCGEFLELLLGIYAHELATLNQQDSRASLLLIGPKNLNQLNDWISMGSGMGEWTKRWERRLEDPAWHLTWKKLVGNFRAEERD